MALVRQASKHVILIDCLVSGSQGRMSANIAQLQFLDLFQRNIAVRAFLPAVAPELITGEVTL